MVTYIFCCSFAFCPCHEHVHKDYTYPKCLLQTMAGTEKFRSLQPESVGQWYLFHGFKLVLQLTSLRSNHACKPNCPICILLINSLQNMYNCCTLVCKNWRGKERNCGKLTGCHGNNIKRLYVSTFLGFCLFAATTWNGVMAQISHDVPRYVVLTVTMNGTELKTSRIKFAWRKWSNRFPWNHEKHKHNFLN